MAQHIQQCMPVYAADFDFPALPFDFDGDTVHWCTDIFGAGLGHELRGSDITQTSGQKSLGVETAPLHPCASDTIFHGSFAETADGDGGTVGAAPDNPRKSLGFPVDSSPHSRRESLEETVWPQTTSSSYDAMVWQSNHTAHHGTNAGSSQPSITTSEGVPELSPASSRGRRRITAPTSAKMERSRAKNRAAASKYRSKTQRQINELKRKEELLSVKGSELRTELRSSKEEVLSLRGEILKHGGCHCNYIEAYLAKSALEFTQRNGAS
ncbi:hypothetical protein Micbo1qcDRAFT_209390 [Microdochium bolleyi]|uniref:BZIP domain-containing protein n=1 Tax=Microdochium bolleyi TaxID=196109 RepID=A0A136IM55_9PEZI|nr:hypothetical protein Micbo1qcDRAFT_209390 [Microdochium bolleyi]